MTSWRICELFKKVTFAYLPREKNQLADALATMSSRIKLPIKVRLAPLVKKKWKFLSYEMINGIEEEE